MECEINDGISLQTLCYKNLVSILDAPTSLFLQKRKKVKHFSFPQWRAIVYYLKRSEEFPIFALILYSLTQLVSNYRREMFCHLQNSLSIWAKNRMVVGVSKRTEISFLKSTLKNVSFNHAERSRRTVSFSMRIYLNLRYNWCQMSCGWIFKNSAVLSSLYVL